MLPSKAESGHLGTWVAANKKLFKHKTDHRPYYITNTSACLWPSEKIWNVIFLSAEWSLVVAVSVLRFLVEYFWDYNVGINSTQCCGFPYVQDSCQSPWMNGDSFWICCYPAITMAKTHATVHIHAHHWPLLIGSQIWPGVTWSIWCLNGWALDILSTYCRLCHVTCLCLRRISTTRVC